jgi:hypothetical protein
LYFDTLISDRRSDRNVACDDVGRVGTGFEALLGVGLECTETAIIQIAGPRDVAIGSAPPSVPTVTFVLVTYGAGYFIVRLARARTHSDMQSASWRPLRLFAASRHSACKVERAGDRYYQAILRGREHIYLAEVKRRLPELTHFSRQYGQAMYVRAKDSFIHGLHGQTLFDCGSETCGT